MVGTEQALNDFLASAQTSLQAISPYFKVASFLDDGIRVNIHLDIRSTGSYLHVQVIIGMLPKVGIAAFLRRLLEIHEGGCYFSVTQDGYVSLQLTQLLVELLDDDLQRKTVHNTIKSLVHIIGDFHRKYVPSLVQEFGLPEIPQRR